LSYRNNSSCMEGLYLSAHSNSAATFTVFLWYSINTGHLSNPLGDAISKKKRPSGLFFLDMHLHGRMRTRSHLLPNISLPHHQKAPIRQIRQERICGASAASSPTAGGTAHRDVRARLKIQPFNLVQESAFLVPSRFQQRGTIPPPRSQQRN